VENRFFQGQDDRVMKVLSSRMCKTTGITMYTYTSMTGFCSYINYINYIVSRDSAVGIATGYGLDD
jgi:hypothetical protein